MSKHSFDVRGLHSHAGIVYMLTAGALLSASLLSTAVFASPLDPPSSSVSFIVNQTGTPAFGVVNDPVYASNNVASPTGSPFTYAGSAWATYGAVGASSSFSDSNSPVPSHGLLAITSFVDQLYISSPGSSSATYRWTPTVHLTGQGFWTEQNTGLGTPLWSVAVANAQLVKGATDADYVRTSSPDIFPGNGELVDTTFELPEIIVPANEWFNYKFTFIVNARVFTSGGYSVSAANGNFLGTMRVVGLDVADMAGTTLNFNVQSGSGSKYTQTGIEAVPEPSTMGLAAAGMLLLAWKQRRRG